MSLLLLLLLLDRSQHRPRWDSLPSDLAVGHTSTQVRFRAAVPSPRTRKTTVPIDDDVLEFLSLCCALVVAVSCPQRFGCSD